MSLPESDDDELLPFELLDTARRNPILRPVGGLEDLCKVTKFTRQEIRVMYRGFKQDCPEGVVQENVFKDIYGKFFPHGNSAHYAHYVFKAFDINCNGAISFKDLLMSLSTLLRGSLYEKLKWAFKLYDIDGDGCITRGELEKIIFSVHELMGKKCQGGGDKKARNHVETVFSKLDLNQDGVITIEEFIESCLRDDVVVNGIQFFDWRL